MKRTSSMTVLNNYLETTSEYFSNFKVSYFNMFDKLTKYLNER